MILMNRIFPNTENILLKLSFLLFFTLEDIFIGILNSLENFDS